MKLLSELLHKRYKDVGEHILTCRCESCW